MATGTLTVYDIIVVVVVVVGEVRFGPEGSLGIA